MFEPERPPNYDPRFPDRKEFPKCNVHGYNICCNERPWTPERKGRWQHPQARSAGHDRDHGLGISCAQYQCPICGKHFEVELSQ